MTEEATTYRVVVTDHVFTDLETERGLLAPLGAELVLAPSTDEATLTELARGADALLVCYAPVPRAVVEAAAEGGVRVISRYGIGYDNVDVDAASEHGILVTNVPDYCLDEVADHTMALLLAAARGVVEACASVRHGGWAVPQTRIHSLRGRQLTLVGLGRIGVKVAERALPFGLRVVAFDPFVTEAPLAGIELAGSLAEALAGADLVSLHVPMSAANRHLVDDAAIALMTRSPVLVNTSRGGLVDLDATTRALEDGRLAGVALDVTEPEPLPADHPLRTHPRAIVTPHMAFYSEEAQAELQRRAADEVARALEGKPPRSPVNADRLGQAAS
ncbi:MAG TPA: C-terminal binding protein [Gaiellaceae bacterium]|nr:C-terminal binding protein [Gaiellaceae bacterium]